MRELVERYPSAACSCSVALATRALPPFATSFFRMYNGRAIDSPVAISAYARAILTRLHIADDFADGLVVSIVGSEGLASFDDFRCKFRIAELVATARMPVGHTAIDEPGFHDTRLRQVWEAITLYRDWMMPWRSIGDFQAINRLVDSRMWSALPIEEPGTRKCAVNGAFSVDGKNPAVSCRRGYAAPLRLAPPRTRDRCCRPPCFCRSSRCPSWCWHPDADAVLLPHSGER